MQLHARTSDFRFRHVQPRGEGLQLALGVRDLEDRVGGVRQEGAVDREGKEVRNGDQVQQVLPNRTACPLLRTAVPPVALATQEAPQLPGFGSTRQEGYRESQTTLDSGYAA